MTLTGRQIRDARYGAGLEIGDLATRFGMDCLHLAYAEAIYGAPAWDEAEFDHVRAVLEAARVESIPESGDGSGVRLRKGES